MNETLTTLILAARRYHEVTEAGASESEQSDAFEDLITAVHCADYSEKRAGCPVCGRKRCPRQRRSRSRT